MLYPLRSTYFDGVAAVHFRYAGMHACEALRCEVHKCLALLAPQGGMVCNKEKLKKFFFFYNF